MQWFCELKKGKLDSLEEYLLVIILKSACSFTNARIKIWNSIILPRCWNTLGPRDYDSFAVAILSQNHREINIAELILVSTKVVIKGDILMMSSTIWLPVWHLRENCHFSALGRCVSIQICYTVIPKTPLYKDINE